MEQGFKSPWGHWYIGSSHGVRVGTNGLVSLVLCLICVSLVLGPSSSLVQDTSLSRRTHGFESHWAHFSVFASVSACLFLRFSCHWVCYFPSGLLFFEEKKLLFSNSGVSFMNLCIFHANIYRSCSLSCAVHTLHPLRFAMLMLLLPRA